METSPSSSRSTNSSTCGSPGADATEDDWSLSLDYPAVARAGLDVTFAATVRHDGGFGGPVDTVTLALNSQPSADVNVSVTSSDTGEGTAAPANLTFTKDNWQAPQTITVKGVNDDEQDGSVEYKISFGVTTSDSSYSGLRPGDVTVTNTDNDTAGVSVLGAGSLQTSEANGKASFQLKLNTAPTGDVTITVASSDTTEIAVEPATIKFTTADWSAPKTVNLTGVDDDEIDGPKEVNITFAVARPPEVLMVLTAVPVSSRPPFLRAIAARASISL